MTDGHGPALSHVALHGSFTGERGCPPVSGGG